MSIFIITGTDTNIGKTVLAAGLAGVLRSFYWKPVQSGLTDESDSQTVRRLSGLSEDFILPEAYRLQAPLSPHRAAQLQGITIEREQLHLPEKSPLLIEGAGGLMVPLNDNFLTIDLFQSWNHPIILCARTELGTINHTLLSLEALNHRSMPVLGVAFIGEENRDNQAMICRLGDAKMLGRLQILPQLTQQSLQQAITASFNLDDFRGAL